MSIGFKMTVIPRAQPEESAFFGNDKQILRYAQDDSRLILKPDLSVR